MLNLKLTPFIVCPLNCTNIVEPEHYKLKCCRIQVYVFLKMCFEKLFYFTNFNNNL